MHGPDTLWRPARGDVLRGRSRTCAPCIACDLCARSAPRQAPLPRGVLGCQSLGALFFTQPQLLPAQEQGKNRACSHAGASLETPVPTSQGGVMFSPQGSTQGRESMAGLCCATAHPGGIPRLPLGEPEFGWLEKLSPQADAVPHQPKKNPNIPLKLVFRALKKKLIRKSALAGLFCLEVFH